MSEIGKVVINAKMPLEKALVSPTGVYCPMIMFTTANVADKKLRTSMQIQLAAAKVENAGMADEQWTPTGQTHAEHIYDINDLGSDVADLVGKQLAQIYADLLKVIETINATRKLL